jgi:hypothetical protein
MQVNGGWDIQAFAFAFAFKLIRLLRLGATKGRLVSLRTAGVPG